MLLALNLKIYAYWIPIQIQDKHACVTETHLKNNEPFKLTGFNIYKNYREVIHSSGRVANLIKKICQTSPIYHPQNNQYRTHDLKNVISNGPLQSTNELDSRTQHLTESLIKWNKIGPCSQKSNKKIPNFTPPFPKYIQELIKEKHKAWRIWKRSRKTEIKKRLNQLTRRVKWELDNYIYDYNKIYLSKLNLNDVSL